MNKQFFVDLVTFLLVFLFVYAAVSKLIDFQQFQIQLLKSPLLHVIAVPVSVLTPIAEILIAVMLCFGSMKLIGLYASFSIMLIFTFYIVAITRFSSYVPCSCGGILQKMSWNQHLVFNIVFTILALSAALLYPNKSKHVMGATI